MNLKLELERVQSELEQVEQFVDLLPNILDTEEGRRHIPSIEQVCIITFPIYSNMC